MTSDTLICPICDIPLAETRSRQTVMWACPSCHGRAIGMALLRRIAFRKWVNELWGHVVEASAPAITKCPSCRSAMNRASVTDLRIDVCKACQLVWFDKGEYERVPLLPERGSRTLPQDALESIARQQATVISAAYTRRFGTPLTVSDALPLVPGVAGLPIEAEQRSLAHWPWVTWALCAVIAAVGTWSLVASATASRFGLTASDIDRLAGATFITALLVHSNVFQLATNLYFLLMFGDNVEDFLGPAVFGTLFLTGGLVGNALHALLALDNSGPLMSSSGAISAVVVFYACRFPNARLRFMRWTGWHTMPAVAGLLFWLLSKLVSTHSFFGRSEPSAWPYVGGAAIGLVFWLALRNDSRT